MEIRNEILSKLKARNTSIQDFNFDNLWAPPLLSFLTVEDIEYFRKLATSIKYSARIQFKYNEIDRIMRMRGFVKLSAGTNRIVYRYLENNKICIKIAIDDVGMKDNPREFENQEFFKPFVTKIFEVSPCGTVALVERVEIIKSREEFASVAGDVFDVLSKWFIGKYVLEDVGSKTFLNWGLRNGFGIVLLDFPYAYEIDGSKLYCSLLLEDGQICNGEIDYDDGFNYLQCTKCGAKYKGIELQKAIESNNVIIEKTKRKVGSNMKVVAKQGSKVVKAIDPEVATKKVISRREKAYNERADFGSDLVVKTSYVKKGIDIPEEVKEAIVDPIEIVAKNIDEVTEKIEEATVDVVEDTNLEPSELKFNTESKFIPPSDIPEESVEETVVDDIPIEEEDAGESENTDDEISEEITDSEDDEITPAPDVEEDESTEEAEEEVVSKEIKKPSAKKPAAKRVSKKYDPEYYK